MKLYLFPTFAAPDTKHENAWRLPVSGAFLKSKTKNLQRKVLVNLLKRLTDVSQEELESPICLERTAPFFLTACRKKEVQFLVNSQPFANVKKIKRNGQFRTKILIKQSELPDNELSAGSLLLEARQLELDVVSDQLKVSMISARGRSIISDIDDTIKFSNVDNRAELLANTFMREFQAIEGMADVYQKLLQQDFAFHYVTASPWQLFQPLAKFIKDKNYPDGSMHFRTFRISDQLIKRLGVIHRSGKAAQVRRILAAFPNRKFTLIGDSGEKDAEIYARCYRQFPERVERVLIRLIHPEHQYRESVLESRLIMPDDVFHTFGSADQLGDLMMGS